MTSSARKLLTAPILAALGVASLTLLLASYTHLKARELAQQYTQRRLVGIADQILLIAGAGRTEAKLLARTSAHGVPEVESRLLSSYIDTALAVRTHPTSGEARVARVLRRSSDSTALEVGALLPLPPWIRPGEGGSNFQRANGALHLVMYEMGPDGQVVCAALSLERVLKRVSNSTSGTLELRVEELGAGRLFAQTPGWSEAASDFEASTEIGGKHATATVRVRPTADLLERVGSHYPMWILSLGLLASLLTYLGLARGQQQSRRVEQLTALAGASSLAHKKALEDTLRNLCSAASVQCFMAEPNGEFTVHGPWAELVGRQGNNFSLDELMQGVVDGPTVRRSLQAAMTARESWSYTYRQVLDGDSRTYQTTAVPVLAVGGEYLGLLGIKMDVSEIVKAQDEAAKSEALRAWQEGYLRQLSCELNGPMHHISATLGRVEEAARRGDERDTLRWLAMGQAAARRMEATVSGALALVQLKARRGAAFIAPGYADQLVRKVVEASRDAAKSKSQQLEVRGEILRPACFAQSNLVQITEQLLSNAMKFSPVGATIRIELSEAKAHCAISVCDAGPGMSDDELVNVGAPFFRAASSAGTEGRGLGLSLAMQLAEDSGLSLTLSRSTESGRGLVAQLRLPLDDSSPSRPAAKREHA